MEESVYKVHVQILCCQREYLCICVADDRGTENPHHVNAKIWTGDFWI